MTRTPLIYIYALPAFLLLLVGVTACGSAEKSMKRGDAAWALGEYAEAAGQYRKAYSQASPKDKALRGRIAYKMGEAYRRYGNTARAVGAFRNAERYKMTDTLTRRHLGDLLRMQGDYKGALAAYTAYLDSFPGDPMAEIGREACLTAAAERAKGSAYTVRQVAQFNGSRSDYAPAYMGQEAQQIYFTSTRPKSSPCEFMGAGRCSTFQ